MRLQNWRRLGLMPFEWHLSRSLQKILAEILQNLPRGQKQAMALIRFDGQRNHGRLIGIRDQLVSPDRIGRQFLFVGHQVSNRARFTSRGVASSTKAAIASSVGITFWPSLPRRPMETAGLSASLVPTPRLAR